MALFGLTQKTLTLFFKRTMLSLEQPKKKNKRRLLIPPLGAFRCPDGVETHTPEEEEDEPWRSWPGLQRNSSDLFCCLVSVALLC